MQQLSNTNVYAIRCANPNYSWAQHLADTNRTGTCQQQNLASGKAQWDFVVLQARPAPSSPSAACGALALSSTPCGSTRPTQRVF